MWPLFVSTKISWLTDERQRRRARKTQLSINGRNKNKRANWSLRDLNYISKPECWTSSVTEATQPSAATSLNSLDCASIASYLPCRHQTVFVKATVIQSPSVSWKRTCPYLQTKKLRARHIGEGIRKFRLLLQNQECFWYKNVTAFRVATPAGTALIPAVRNVRPQGCLSSLRLGVRGYTRRVIWRPTRLNNFGLRGRTGEIRSGHVNCRSLRKVVCSHWIHRLLWSRGLPSLLLIR